MHYNDLKRSPTAIKSNSCRGVSGKIGSVGVVTIPYITPPLRKMRVNHHKCVNSIATTSTGNMLSMHVKGIFRDHRIRSTLFSTYSFYSPIVSLQPECFMQKQSRSLHFRISDVCFMLSRISRKRKIIIIWNFEHKFNHITEIGYMI